MTDVEANRANPLCFCFYRDNNGSNDRVNERTPLLDDPARDLFYNKLWAGIFIGVIVLVVGMGTYLLVTEDEMVYIESFPLVTRKDWKARAVTKPMNEFQEHPISKIILVQTNSSDCSGEFQCSRYLQTLQNYSIAVLNESDILYNFLIDRDGRVYEGRGWTFKADYQKNSDGILSVAFLGNYDIVPPTERQISNLKAFLDFLVMENILSLCYEIVAEFTRRRFFIDIAYRLEEIAKTENNCNFYL